MWNKLLAVLDQALGFPNKITSNVVKKWQGFDNVTQEHVIHLEYRVKVRPSEPFRPSNHPAQKITTQEANLLRELLKLLTKQNPTNR